MSDSATSRAPAGLITDAHREAAAYIADRTGVETHDGLVVLGSGWTPASDHVGEVRAEIAMSDIPGFIDPVAEGHVARLRSVELGGRRVLVHLGRTHLYENHGVARVVHPVLVAAATGIRIAVLTNANGSFRDEWPLGTPVLIRDHLNFTARSPLPGPMFVDLSDCWSQRLRDIAHSVHPMPEAVYAIVPGPHYETPAEARMFRLLGADVIGMSTVMEAIALHAAGIEVLGMSVVTALEFAPSQIDPSEVVAIAQRSAAATGPVIADVMQRALS